MSSLVWDRQNLLPKHILIGLLKAAMEAVRHKQQPGFLVRVWCYLPSLQEVLLMWPVWEPERRSYDSLLYVLLSFLFETFIYLSVYYLRQEEREIPSQTLSVVLGRGTKPGSGNSTWLPSWWWKPLHLSHHLLAHRFYSSRPRVEPGEEARQSRSLPIHPNAPILFKSDWRSY